MITIEDDDDEKVTYMSEKSGRENDVIVTDTVTSVEENEASMVVHDGK